MNNKNCDNIKLDKKKLSFGIYNKLRLLGIKTNNQGAKLIYLAILIIINSNNEFMKLEEVYSIISEQLKNISNVQIRRSIQYAIDIKIKENQKIILRKYFILNMMKVYLQINVL